MSFIPAHVSRVGADHAITPAEPSRVRRNAPLRDRSGLLVSNEALHTEGLVPFAITIAYANILAPDKVLTRKVVELLTLPRGDAQQTMVDDYFNLFREWRRDTRGLSAAETSRALKEARMIRVVRALRGLMQHCNTVEVGIFGRDCSTQAKRDAIDCLFWALNGVSQQSLGRHEGSSYIHSPIGTVKTLVFTESIKHNIIDDGDEVDPDYEEDSPYGQATHGAYHNSKQPKSSKVFLTENDMAHIKFGHLSNVREITTVVLEQKTCTQFLRFFERLENVKTLEFGEAYGSVLLPESASFPCIECLKIRVPVRDQSMNVLKKMQNLKRLEISCADRDQFLYILKMCHERDIAITDLTLNHAVSGNDFRRITRLADLRSLRLRCACVTENLRRCKLNRLQKLNRLALIQPVQEDIEYVTTLPLKHLDLECVDVEDEPNFDEIPKLSLKSLRIAYMHGDEDEVRFLLQLPHLQTLDYHYLHMSNLNLLTCKSTLKTLNLNYNFGETAEGMNHGLNDGLMPLKMDFYIENVKCLEAFTKLETLLVRNILDEYKPYTKETGTSDFMHRFIDAIGTVQGLKRLDMSLNDLTSDHVERICEKFPNLVHLNISDNVYVTDQCLPALLSLKHLERLVVDKTSLSKNAKRTIRASCCQVYDEVPIVSERHFNEIHYSDSEPDSESDSD